MKRFVDINAITGNIKTFDEALEEAAAFSIRNTYPTYSKVPSDTKFKKTTNGIFVSFPAEILRTGAKVTLV